MLDYKSIQTASGVTGYAEIGAGDPLVLVVGYSGTLFHWNSQFVNELALKHKVYLIDNRKVGLSTSNNPDSIAGFALDVIDFIQAKNLVKPTIVGWSLGGVIVQELLKTHEHMVSNVVLLSSLPNMSYMIPDFFDLLVTAHHYTTTEFRQQLYKFFFSEDAVEQARDIIMSNALPLNDYQYRFNIEAKALQDSVVPTWSGMTDVDLAKIQIPVLLLWAKDDLVVNGDAIRVLSVKIRSSKAIIYPRGGHFLIQDAPRQVARDINNFLTV